MEKIGKTELKHSYKKQQRKQNLLHFCFDRLALHLTKIEALFLLNLCSCSMSRVPHLSSAGT